MGTRAVEGSGWVVIACHFEKLFGIGSSKLFGTEPGGDWIPRKEGSASARRVLLSCRHRRTHESSGLQTELEYRDRFETAGLVILYVGHEVEVIVDDCACAYAIKQWVSTFHDVEFMDASCVIG